MKILNYKPGSCYRSSGASALHLRTRRICLATEANGREARSLSRTLESADRCALYAARICIELGMPELSRRAAFLARLKRMKSAVDYPTNYRAPAGISARTAITEAARVAIAFERSVDIAIRTRTPVATAYRTLQNKRDMFSPIVVAALRRALARPKTMPRVGPRKSSTAVTQCA